MVRGYSHRDIALTLGKTQSSISRDIKRNSIRSSTAQALISYTAASANKKARLRRAGSKQPGMKIYGHEELERYIVGKLKNGFSPEAIAGRMWQEKKPFYASKKAIYEFLYSVYGQKYCRYLLTRRYRKKKKKGIKEKRSLIPNKISIHDRPNRDTTYGHIEADTILSGKKTKSTWALSTVYDHQSMYIDARKILSLSPKYHTQALVDMLKRFKRIRSITQDNGHENISHELVKHKLHTNTFFCDPHSPWQKPGIENANKLIRRVIPKGSNINDYSVVFIRSYITKLNNRPRKKLGWKTPNEIIMEHKLLKKQEKRKTSK